MQLPDPDIIVNREQTLTRPLVEPGELVVHEHHATPDPRTRSKARTLRSAVDTIRRPGRNLTGFFSQAPKGEMLVSRSATIRFDSLIESELRIPPLQRS
jgi:hypothetical protein